MVCAFFTQIALTKVRVSRTYSPFYYNNIYHYQTKSPDVYRQGFLFYLFREDTKQGLEN